MLAGVHALAWLAATAVLAAASPVEVALGGSSLRIDVAIEVRTVAGGTESPALAWATLSDGAIEGRTEGSGWEGAVRFRPVPGGASDAEVRVRWLVPADVERVALRLYWPGAARALSRTLAFLPLVRPVRTGRGTPVLAAAGGAVLAGGPGIIAALFEPAAGRLAPQGVPTGSAASPRVAGLTATLLVDDADERPFSTYVECLDRLPHGPESQPIHWADLEVRRAVRGAPRAAGAEDRGRATLYPLDESAQFRPVVVERWPGGARAAIVVTDHADRTDAAALRAVLWGSSDPRAEGGVGAGFLGRGLRLTRTFFAHARSGALDDPEIRLLAQDLADEGSEVALHSITPERDDRDAVREGLASAAPWRPVTWVDHQPYTNCEAVSSRGWGTDWPFGVRDLLVAAGIRWVWAAGDVEGRSGPRVVNLFGGDPGRPRPAIFPLPQDPELWVFRSSMFHAPGPRLAEALSEAALASLERERGLFVAHTYLGASPRAPHASPLANRFAVVEASGGTLAVDPALDAALARIATRVRAGKLASLGWAEAGDRLRALGEVEVRYLSDGSAEIWNRGDADLGALTVALPAAGLEMTAEGTALLGREDEGGSARLWFDLPAGERVLLRASDGVMPVPLLPFR